ncbi:hypothetical protein ANCCAN_14439 [Ancylostoma caninum]|uniref:Uncharacterized protein n=1 Tax=Ancylostoma caninum TaxID=29170 RepID=A0A368G5A0_ANCCA|nr:hypothetical protein ANCCAN_14439 [Ancylostoma caninum]
MSDDSPGLRIVDEGAGPSDANGGSGDITLTPLSENVHPARKNGFICSQVWPHSLMNWRHCAKSPMHRRLRRRGTVS